MALFFLCSFALIFTSAAGRLMQKVTAIIPTYNEEANIERSLQSVQWADEIIVVDSFSTDRTVEIAEKLAHKVVQHEYKNSAAQKNWIIPQAAHPWIFLLDADEWVVPELRDEVQKILREGTDISAFWIKRQNYFFGKKVKYSGWQDDAVIRLFRKDNSRYQDLHVHAEVETSGKIGWLKNKLHHNTYISFSSLFTKLEKYTTWGAYDRVNKTKKVTLYHLMIKPMFRFFKHYILKLGFLDGREGFIISALSSYNVFLRAFKIIRLKEGEKIKRDY